MHLTPRELDKLVLHGAGSVAQKRLARGLRLSYPEAVALIATVLLELIRDGRGVAELMGVGRQMLGQRQVMDGVASLIAEVQVEGTFPDGTKLVTVHAPIADEHGDLALALDGSFLPVPPRERFAASAGGDGDEAFEPGAIEPVPGELVLNETRAAIALEIVHRGDRPIQVGSHYPFAETNRALEFDRARARGMRLDVPAGTAVRFEPGERKTVALIPYLASAESAPQEAP